MRVVLWIYVDTMFREMVRVARLLKRRSPYRPLIWFAYRYTEIERDFAICRAEGIDFEDHTAAFAIGVNSGDNPWRRWLVSGCKTALAWTRRLQYAARRRLFGEWLPGPAFTGLYRHYRNRHEAVRAEVKRLKPCLLILPEDNLEYETASWIQACHEVGAAAVIIPFTLANAGEFAEAYWNNPDYHFASPANERVGRTYPQWVYHYKGRELIRLPAEHVWAQERLKLAPPRPWTYNSGAADAIAVESDAVLDYFVRAGIPRRQLRVTGSLRQDDLAQVLPGAGAERERILRELGLNQARKVILCAFPPDQRPHNRPSCEFQTYADVVEFWARSLGSLEDCSVLVNLHPRHALDELKYIERWGVRIVQGDIAKLIPLCDLYVASVSATICLAVACGKPVVNYDVYRYGYDDFAGVRLVTTMDSKQAFVQALRDHLRALATPHAGAHTEARAWGNLDGKAQDRLLCLFEELVSGKNALSGQRPAA